MPKTKKSKTIQPFSKNQDIPSIDELWGIKTDKYSAGSIEEYETFLNQMTELDLQTHASKYQVSHQLPRETMIDQLKRLYRIDHGSKKAARPTSGGPLISPETNKELIRLGNL